MDQMNLRTQKGGGHMMLQGKKKVFFAGIVGLCLTILLSWVLFAASAGQVHATDVKEIKNDGRFITYSDGTVLDGRTKLMWAGRDNGSNIGWHDAKRYCMDFRGGNYTDWRMPTHGELTGLYASGAHKETIGLTGHWVWASETRDNTAAYFLFNLGLRYWIDPSYTTGMRALPVRVKK